MRTELRIAIPKGQTTVTQIFKQAGYSISDELEVSRKYIIPIPYFGLSFILAKAIDIPTYVAYGAADIGIVGKEVLLENQRDVYELLDLGITPNTLAVFGKLGQIQTNPKVATAYPNIASAYYRDKGQQAEIIPLNGSLELATESGLADCIVDVVGSINVDRSKLSVLDTIQHISSRLIANRASYMLNNDQINQLCDRLSAAIAIHSQAAQSRTTPNIVLEERSRLGE
ncbi:ATP phosphoribosyltransferase [Paenibacillus cellulosilyticus]|uniref:ATP phosphoribosyltransferase n=1 Tax=Paenibacillus cellulosilyticus TaxID=375489 RepID=A0A2V2YMR3_9BACL|nr:ATP phosphoribosyltransferase [Paenibacillus cellulosilyticus]PWV95858.1 ATP phosphoribosyltransferase [Paenibacillus cellulosilyticus]QKS47730.1 ATP phosphoribosyltransferase [Paenibacillus cellulosilyticus]